MARAALTRFMAQVKSSHEVKLLTGVSAFREDLVIALSRLTAAWAAQEQVRQKREETPTRSRTVAPVFHAVPPYVGSAPFTGRAEDLAGLDDWGRSGDPVMVVEALGGTGKSALTWQWTQDRAPDVIGGLAGRLWWSFYDGSASMTRFLQELRGYVSTLEKLPRLAPADLADEVVAALRSRPYLVVLDGFERLLTAYHQFDPSKVRDEEATTDKRSLIEARANDIVRKLAAAVACLRDAERHHNRLGQQRLALEAGQRRAEAALQRGAEDYW